MKDDAELIANRDKRPLYRDGQRVQINRPQTPALNGWQGEILGVSAVQSADAFVVTYIYRLRMDNLASIDAFEEDLQLAEVQGEQA